MNEIQRMIDTRTGDTVNVPAGMYVVYVTVPSGVHLVFERGTTLEGSVTVMAGGHLDAGGSFPDRRP